MQKVLLNDGNAIPAVGFGVFMIPSGGPPTRRRSRRCSRHIRSRTDRAGYGMDDFPCDKFKKIQPIDRGRSGDK